MKKYSKIHFYIYKISWFIFCLIVLNGECMGSWICNYLCNQCLSPLKVWVQILLMAVYSIYLCDKVCQWLATCRWVSPGTPVSSTNKTDRHDITEILLKVMLNNITLYLTFVYISCISFNMLQYYTLRFYFPYLSLLAQPVNIFVYGPVNILVYGPGTINIMFSSGFCPNSFFCLRYTITKTCRLTDLHVMSII